MGKPDPANPSSKPQDDKKQSGTDPISKTPEAHLSRARVVIHRKIRVVRKAAVISRSRVVKTPSGRPSAKGAFGRP